MHLKNASISVARPITFSLHFGQMHGFKAALVRWVFVNHSFRISWKMKHWVILARFTDEVSLCRWKMKYFSRTVFALDEKWGIELYLQGSQMRCPFLHWKMRVGGTISSKHTWSILWKGCTKAKIMKFFAAVAYFFKLTYYFYYSANQHRELEYWLRQEFV